MLPSFRMIAMTFLCGFAVVFAGLRVASSLNDIHEGLPVTAAYAAPAPAEVAADPEMRRGRSAVPVIYDMRFVVSAASAAPTLVNLTPPLDLSPPVMAPIIAKVTREELPPPPEASPGKARSEPKPEPAAAVAAIPQQSPPETSAPASFDIPLPDPAPVDLTPSPITVAPAETPPAKAAAVEPAATIAPAPAAKAKPALRARSKTVRKKRVRTARRAAKSDPSGNSFSSPFGGTPQ
jgi:hypothetical protein